MRPALLALVALAGIGALVAAGTMFRSPVPSIHHEPTEVVPGTPAGSVEPDPRPLSRAAEVTDTVPETPPEPAKKRPTRSFGRSLELVTWESIAAEGLPAPPPQFTASPFRWRLKHPIARERIEGFVRKMGILSVDERTALLQVIRRSKDRRYGVVLLAELPSVPDNPGTLFGYASAMIETAAAPDAGEPPVPRRELTSAALALLAGRTTKYGSVLQESEWEGIRAKLERIRKVDPTLLQDPSSLAAMTEIRRGLGIALEKALSREVGYLGGVACFRMAAQFGDEGIHEILCRLLKEWDAVRTRFPRDGEKDLVAHYHAVRSVLKPPCPSHAACGVDALIARLRGEPEGNDLSRLKERVRGYGRDKYLSEDFRRRLYEALGEEMPKEEPKWVPPPPAPKDPEPPKYEDTYR